MPPERPVLGRLGRLGIDRRLAGYALINGFTFGVDIALLTTLHGGLGWPLPAAVTVSYATAFALAYVLNRRFNFHSHAPVHRQLPVYAGIVALNYLLWLLLATDLISAAGVDYRLARLLAGGGEAVSMYVAMRWIVFRDAQPEDS